MLANALDFAPGTAEANKKVIVGMYDPKFLLQMYRTACREHGTRDIVLMCPNVNEPNGLFAGRRTPKLGLVSAHTQMQLPIDSDAFWLIVSIPQSEMPVTAIMYAVPYEQVAAGEAFAGEA